MSIRLAAIEDIIDASGAAAIEDLLPHGVRGRQLTTRTLLTGMMLTVTDSRPTHLTRLRQALTGLPQAGQARLGVTTAWKTGPHQLTYRQVEHTCRLITRALAKDKPDGADALRSRDMRRIFHLFRQYAGASQTRIGIACGLTQGKVSAIMSGSHRVTALDVFERIADGLGMPPEARLALGLAVGAVSGLGYGYPAPGWSRPTTTLACARRAYRGFSWSK